MGNILAVNGKINNKILTTVLFALDEADSQNTFLLWYGGKYNDYDCKIMPNILYNTSELPEVEEKDISLIMLQTFGERSNPDFNSEYGVYISQAGKWNPEPYMTQVINGSSSKEPINDIIWLYEGEDKVILYAEAEQKHDIYVSKLILGGDEFTFISNTNYHAHKVVNLASVFGEEAKIETEKAFPSGNIISMKIADVKPRTLDS